MDDLISREAAIEMARKCSVKEVTPNYILIDKAEIMAELMMLPSAKPKKVEPFNTEEKVMFINMVEMMRKECDKDFYYSPILSSVKQKVRDVFWTSSV